MRIIVVNGRKIGATIIIIGLMLVLLGVEQHFDNQLKMTALIKNNIGTLTEYTGMNGKLTYQLPKEWGSKEEKFEGDEILYHNDFKSKDSGISGYVQVWKKRNDLKKFLSQSKEISAKQNIIKGYNIKSIKINSSSGYLVMYDVYKVNEKDTYKVYQYFIDEKESFVNFSFFIKENNFKENMPSMFKSIVKKLKYN